MLTAFIFELVHSITVTTFYIPLYKYVWEILILLLLWNYIPEERIRRIRHIRKVYIKWKFWNFKFEIGKYVIITGSFLVERYKIVKVEYYFKNDVSIC